MNLIAGKDTRAATDRYRDRQMDEQKHKKTQELDSYTMPC